MEYNYLLYLFGISAYLIAGSVTREAIINGDAVNNFPFRYMVSIWTPHSNHTCGGSIIGDEFILTAASCLITDNWTLIAKPIFIHAGTNDLQKTDEIVQVEKVIRSRYYIHMNFDQRHGHVSDIAVLKLKRPLDLQNNTNLIKLLIPSSNNIVMKKTAIFTGYGWHWIEIRDQKQYGGRYDSLVRYAKANILSPQECEHQHPGLPNFRQYLCASLKQRDASRPSGACFGDGGGPLVLNNKYVVGVLSENKFDCSEKDSSSVYTRVSSHQKFINDAMNNITTNIVTHNA